MAVIFKVWLGLMLCLLLAGGAWSATTLHHDMKVKVIPHDHSIEVENTLTLAEGMPTEFEITLHSGLDVRIPSPDANYQLTPLNRALLGAVPIRRYSVKLAAGDKTFTLRYQGEIFHPVIAEGEEYARSFSDSPGLISNEGVFLSHESAWYPLLEDGPSVSFKVDVHLPTNWKAVSQGDRLHEAELADGFNIVWQENAPQEEVFLIAAQFTEYKKTAGAVEALAFLRQPDAALAQRYLDVTAQYIEMYRQLIGPYPYSKFALVENFWETGYGMPSFTLLGPRVIRLPFILHSSYPHEILHNWWGNSVYVDISQGNWAEGLTSYLADHLIQEQHNNGAAARRAVLQNYTDFVQEQKEIPLSEFKARHSASSEAVGYGKTQMLFHMLRLQLGDHAFTKGLHRLYQIFKFKEASYADLEHIFGGVADQTLSKFFNQWVSRTGSPELKITTTKVTRQADGWQLSFTVHQQQIGDVYLLDIPIAVTLEGKEQAHQEVLTMDAKAESYTLKLASRPLRIDVDPEFDVFRRLDRAEIPPALSQAFGAAKMLFVLPSAASQTLLQEYKGLVEAWRQSQPADVSVVLDSDIETLPKDTATWLLGWNNRFAKTFQQQMSDYIGIGPQGQLKVGGETFTPEEHSAVLVGRHPEDVQQAVVWLATNNTKAVAGLARKLPHYRKYSYLAFVDDEPTNVAKGQWPVLRSPMTVILNEGQVMPRAQLEARTALVELPSLFDADQLMDDAKALTQPAMAGRGLGSEGIDRAAEVIAGMFQEAGLRPGNIKEQSYFQVWKQVIDGLDGAATLKNVIGFIPGTNPEYQGESVVVSAHYDHLGLGWPDVREGFKGQVHEGADDNASGVAVMMSLARLAGKHWQPERSIVFIAFTGEEAGLLGSRHFVENPMPFSVDKIIGVINLDTVGRLGNAPITVFGTGSASEWVHIFRGIGFVTGLNIQSIANDFGSSDQKSFLDKGIPGVQLFGGVHQDFHTPRDTLDKLDQAGMVKMAMVLKEAVDYLIARPESLTVTLANAKPNGASNTEKRTQGRRVSIGTVPDFTYQGQGVLISDVVSGSPAERAGLQKGDVISQVNGVVITDLAGFASVLRAMSPGDDVEINYVRNSQTHTIKLAVVER